MMPATRANAGGSAPCGGGIRLTDCIPLDDPQYPPHDPFRRLHFRAGDVDAANQLVRRYHYSRRPPANVQWVGTWHEDGGLFGDYGPAVAACFICIPPTRWSQPVYELARLVREPSVTKPLSGLISQTCSHAGRNGANLIVSFADRTQTHHGGVYQAASWNYAGCRSRSMDGVLIDGVFHAGRSCNSAWGTRSPAKLEAILPGRAVEAHYDEGKHLYWRSLTRKGKSMAAALGFTPLPYPKPHSDMFRDAVS